MVPCGQCERLLPLPGAQCTCHLYEARRSEGRLWWRSATRKQEVELRWQMRDARWEVECVTRDLAPCLRGEEQLHEGLIATVRDMILCFPPTDPEALRHNVAEAFPGMLSGVRRRVRGKQPASW